jgi:hypothetical protein
MVIWLYRSISTCTALLFAEQRPRSFADFVKTQQGVKALAALAALVILGFGMVFLTYLGGRFTRRYMNPRIREPPPNPNPEDWARDPIVPREPNPKIGPDNVE